MLIPDKSTNDVYTAVEFTPFKNETQNAIISGGEPLDVADSSQLSKRITLAASHDDFYTSVYSSGTATYQLTGPAIRAYPFEYKIGMRVRFIVDTENDASAALVKLGSLASLNVSTTRLANGETPVFSIGHFLQYATAELLYNETPDGLTRYWMIAKKSLSMLSAGDTDIENSSIKINNTSSSITTTLDGNYLKVSKDDNSKQIYVKDSGLTVVDTDFNSNISNDKPVRIDISSASWILSTDVYISSINTSLFRPFSVYSPPYLGSIMGYSGSDLIIIPLDMFTIRDTTGTAYLYDIQIRDVGVDPNTITSMALYLRLS